jgi:hypothetical protein
MSPDKAKVKMIENGSVASDATSGDETANDNTPIAQRRAKRADTLPNTPSHVSTGTANDLISGLGLGLDELPPNPKIWTPAQLSTYLVTALRVGGNNDSDGSLAPAVTRDVATFVRQAGITGRVFLRLNDDDLNECVYDRPSICIMDTDIRYSRLGADPLWRAALLTASRNLRQSVLRGRIWGFGPGSPDIDDDGDLGDLADLDADVELPDSPSSDIEVSSSLGGMTHFSLSSSPPGSTMSSTLFSNSKSATVLSSSSTMMHSPPGSTMSPSPSLARLETGHMRRSRSGRVKGMVQNFERHRRSDSQSGSESDASATGSDISNLSNGSNTSNISNGLRTRTNGLNSPRPTSPAYHRKGEPRVPSDPPPQYSPFQPPRSLPALPSPPKLSHTPMLILREEQEEPSMADLLAKNEETNASWGARAWEDMDNNMGDTVKHVSASVHTTGPVAKVKYSGPHPIKPYHSGSHVHNLDEVEPFDPASLRRSGMAKSISRASARDMFGTGTMAKHGGKGEKRMISALFMPEEKETGEDVDAKKEEKKTEAEVEIDDTASAGGGTTLLSFYEDAKEIKDVMPAEEPVPEVKDVDAAAASEDAVTSLTVSRNLPSPPQSASIAATIHTAPETQVAAPEADADIEADGTPAQIAALQAELVATRTALAEMRRRLSIVEARMDSVDTAEAARTSVLQAALEGIRAREADLRSATHKAGEAEAAATRALQAVEERERERVRREQEMERKQVLEKERQEVEARKRAKEEEFSRVTKHVERAAEEEGKVRLPGGLGELPQYVILVGLGVCAVALQVVFKQMTGRPGRLR